MAENLPLTEAEKAATNGNSGRPTSAKKANGGLKARPCW